MIVQEILGMHTVWLYNGSSLNLKFIMSRSNYLSTKMQNWLVIEAVIANCIVEVLYSSCETINWS
jgi:hypothetical protein